MQTKKILNLVLRWQVQMRTAAAETAPAARTGKKKTSRRLLPHVNLRSIYYLQHARRYCSSWYCCKVAMILDLTVMKTLAVSCKWPLVHEHRPDTLPFRAALLATCLLSFFIELCQH